MKKIRCNNCGLTIVNPGRGIAGCGCDPDSPQWVYVLPDGNPRGLSQSSWEVVDDEKQ